MSSILLVSPEPWGHMPVSKHHYAKHLGQQGYKVFFLNPPSGQLLVKPTDADNVFEVNYRGFIRGIRFLPDFLARRSIRRTFQDIESLVGSPIDFIWSFDSSVFVDFDALPSTIFKIVHLVDLNQVRNIDRVARSADLCLCTTQYIAAILRQFNKKVHVINHGFAPSEPSARVFDLRYKLNVGYGGNLDIKYLHWPQIIEAVRQHPEIGFYFAGSCSAENVFGLFQEHSNMHYLGVLDRSDLYAFYTQVDALLLCYDVDNHREQLANPHKLLEYLASGKVIIATSTVEYEWVSHDILPMCRRTDQWNSLFKEVIDNIEKFSAPVLNRRRREIAMQNSYEHHLKKILELIR